MLKLQITTDYAIGIVLYLAQHGEEISPGKDIAKEVGMSYTYFNKVASIIRQSGFIETVQGPSGGYRLSKSAKEITLYDIIEVMEGTLSLNHCLEINGGCRRYGDAYHKCPVHNVLKVMQRELISTLQSKTIQELCELTG